jgi:hypothetical protein
MLQAANRDHKHLGGHREEALLTTCSKSTDRARIASTTYKAAVPKEASILTRRGRLEKTERIYVNYAVEMVAQNPFIIWIPDNGPSAPSITIHGGVDYEN